MKIINKYRFSEMTAPVDTSYPRADFSYSLDKKRKRLSMIDIGHGTMSLTNDIERVLSFIGHLHQVHLDEYDVSYIDSQNERTVVKIVDYEPRNYKTIQVKFS